MEIMIDLSNVSMRRHIPVLELPTATTLITVIDISRDDDEQVSASDSEAGDAPTHVA